MTTKELIQAEIDRLSDEELDELYDLIKRFAISKRENGVPTLMEGLRQIQIDAPEDFSANLDLYLSGEKRVEPNLR